jgi:glycosyltransferase involved in cell wall biosynthesis
MRIAVVVPEYPPYTIGGGGVVFNALVDQLDKHHQVRVYSAHDPIRSWVRGLAPESSPTVRRYPLLPIGNGAAHLRSVIPPNPLAAIQFSRDIVAWKPDVAHLHGYGYGFIDFAALVLRRLQVPYVFTNHGFPVTQETRSAVVRSLYRLYQRVGAGRTARLSVTTTYVSPSVADKERWPSVSPDLVIENGLTPLPSPSLSDCQSLRTRLGLGDSVVIGAAGRLTWSKGFDLLIDSLAHLHHGPVTCVIAGDDGGERTSLIRRASSLPRHLQVVLPGRLNRNDLGTLFALSSVVAVPSRDEPFGLVALEAMAMGTRVVAAATGGLEGFVERPLGSLVTPGDSHSLALGLDAALTTSADPQEDLQRSAIAENRAWDKVAGMYEEALQDALCAGIMRDPQLVR